MAVLLAARVGVRVRVRGRGRARVRARVRGGCPAGGARAS